MSFASGKKLNPQLQNTAHGLLGNWFIFWAVWVFSKSLRQAYLVLVVSQLYFNLDALVLDNEKTEC